ncbi:MAG: hypothetical protein J6N52_12550 [Clostridia bacterium]|nr:hypothetical protein [Clostridia bacterium]
MNIIVTTQKGFNNLKYIEKAAEDAGRRSFGLNKSRGSTNDILATEYNISQLFEVVKNFVKNLIRICFI